MAYSDRELLARLIQCEAGGEGETGMKAVAGVVMNRVHAKGGEYARVGQGSIRKIIFQPYQFVCASETEGGIKNLVVEYKWMPDLSGRFRGELDRTLSAIASEVKALAERYETPLPALEANVAALRAE